MKTKALQATLCSTRRLDPDDSGCLPLAGRRLLNQPNQGRTGIVMTIDQAVPRVVAPIVIHEAIQEDCCFRAGERRFDRLSYPIGKGLIILESGAFGGAGEIDEDHGRIPGLSRRPNFRFQNL